jgi:sugar lactone lactonase YvrE
MGATDSTARAPDSSHAASSARDSVARAAPDSVARAARDSVNAADATPLRFEVAAELITDGVRTGMLIEPGGMTTDAFGRIWVTDGAQHRVMRLDAQGRLLGQTGALGSGEGELRRPEGVALLGTLHVAVLDLENRRVLSYDTNDRLQGTLVDFDAPDVREALGRVEPRGIAGDRGGALIVADSERDRLLVFDVHGRHVRTLGGFGEGPGSFRELAGVGATRRGGMVTIERPKRRVQRLDPSGTAAATWSAGPGEIRGGVAIAVDDSLRVAIADEAGNRVDLFDRNGRKLATWRGAVRPRALAFAPDGTLLVAEAGPGRLVRLRIAPAPRPGRAEP